MKPGENEIKIISALPSDERLSYFLSRIVDNDEVWSISGDTGWKMSGSTSRKIAQLWPAKEYVSSYDPTSNPTMTSLSHFKEIVLPEFMGRNIFIEAFPVKDDAGKILSAQEFNSMLDEEMFYDEL